MKFTIIEGSIKIGKAMQGTGAEVELDPEEAARITKKGVCVLEASDVFKAKAKAKAESEKAIEKAEADVKAKATHESEHAKHSKGGGK